MNRKMRNRAVFFFITLMTFFVSASYAAPGDASRTARSRASTRVVNRAVNQSRSANQNRTVNREAAINQDDLNFDPDANNGFNEQNNVTGRNADRQQVSDQVSQSNAPGVPPNNFAQVNDQSTLITATGDVSLIPAPAPAPAPAAAVATALFNAISANAVLTFGTTDLDAQSLEITGSAGELVNNFSQLTQNNVLDSNATDTGIRYGEWNSADCTGADCVSPTLLQSQWIAGVPTSQANIPSGTITYNTALSLSGASSAGSGLYATGEQVGPVWVPESARNYFTINFANGDITGRIRLEDANSNVWDSGEMMTSGTGFAQNMTLTAANAVGNTASYTPGQQGFPDTLTGQASVFVAGTNGEYAVSGFAFTGANDPSLYVVGTEVMGQAVP